MDDRTKMISAGIVGVLILAGIIWAVQRNSGGAPDASPVPTPTPTEIANETMEERIETAATSTPTPLVSPTPSPAPTATASPRAETSPSPATAAAVKEFTVIGSPFVFSPASLTVKKGDRVRLTFENAAGTHDWRLDAFGAATSVIGAGQRQTIEFVAATAGTFEYYCSVGNHRAMGMKGTLTVQQ